MPSLRIALAQCRQTADLDANAAAIFRMLDEAARQQVQVLCFPETQTVGYRVDIATPSQPVPVERLAELHGEVAARCGRVGMACILGTETPLASDSRHGKPYNSALVISEGGTILGAHHKTRLTPLDALAYTPGRGFETFELFGIRVGVVICFEGLRFADSTRECVRQGAQVIFHPQNNTTRQNDWKVPVHHAMIVTRAAENTVWFASCNACLVPHQNSRSLVVAPDGQIWAQTELRREELLVTDIDVARATRAMFEFERSGMVDVLFANTVRPEELAGAGPLMS
jgi:predicted amidohydrolase